MRRARRDMKRREIEEPGYQDMRTRRGMTEAYVLEILSNKEDRESKTEALAVEMRRIFAEDPTVRIARPTAIIRVRDLDEAVTEEEVIEAIVAKGVSDRREVRASLTRPVNGMGWHRSTAWSRWRMSWPKPAASRSTGRLLG